MPGGGDAFSIAGYGPCGVSGMAAVGRFGYTGQARLGNTGLYYFKARIYAPALGRFLQTDPVGYDSGMNLYAYASTDPINRRDPTGRMDDWLNLITVTGFREFPSFYSIGNWNISSPPDLGYLPGFVAGAIGSWGGYRAQPVSINAGAEYTPAVPESVDDIMVTATKIPSTNQKWVLANGQYHLNPHYVDPAPWLNLQNVIIAPPIIGATASIAVSGEILFAGGRVGLLNSNSYLRIGWGPGANTTRSNFYQQFRIVIGNKDASVHIHIDIPGIIK